MEFIKKVIRKIKDGMLQEMYEETKWMYTYAKKYKFQIVFYIFLGVLTTVMGLASSVGSKYLIDAVTGQDSGNIALIALFIVAMGLFSIGINAITTMISARINIKVNNEIEMVVDASPALAVLDKLVSNEKTTTGPVVGQPTNTQLIKQLTDELEQALGILNPMVIEDLNKEIQEEHTDPELIREALKEAVFNRKTNWNYIKGVLRNWKLSGITTKIQVEERRLEHQGKKQHHQVSDDFKTGMDAARQLWGGQ